MLRKIFKFYLKKKRKDLSYKFPKNVSFSQNPYSFFDFAPLHIYKLQKVSCKYKETHCFSSKQSLFPKKRKFFSFSLKKIFLNKESSL